MLDIAYNTRVPKKCLQIDVSLRLYTKHIAKCTEYKIFYRMLDIDLI